MHTLTLTTEQKERLLYLVLNEIAGEKEFQGFLGRIGFNLPDSAYLNSLNELHSLLIEG